MLTRCWGMLILHYLNVNIQSSVGKKLNDVVPENPEAAFFNEV